MEVKEIFKNESPEKRSEALKQLIMEFKASREGLEQPETVAKKLSK